MMGPRSQRLGLRDRVVGTLHAAAIPIADAHIARSGLAVSPNGRVVRVATSATDGGMGRPVDIWRCYLDLATALLREAGLIARVIVPCQELSVSDPIAETASCDAPTVLCSAR